MAATNSPAHRLRSESISTIIVEQNLEFALKLSDAAVIIEHGKVVDAVGSDRMNDHDRIREKLDIR